MLEKLSRGASKSKDKIKEFYEYHLDDPCAHEEKVKKFIDENPHLIPMELEERDLALRRIVQDDTDFNLDIEIYRYFTKIQVLNFKTNELNIQMYEEVKV